MEHASSDIGWQARTVLHRYCKAIDDHDVDALREVFSDDVVLVVGGDSVEGEGGTQSFAGRDTVVSLLTSLFEQRRWARHLVSNELVGIADGGRVDVTSYFQYLLSRSDGRVIGIGDYHAVMKSDGEGLRICQFSASILDEVEFKDGGTRA